VLVIDAPEPAKIAPRRARLPRGRDRRFIAARFSREDRLSAADDVIGQRGTSTPARQVSRPAQKYYKFPGSDHLSNTRSRAHRTLLRLETF